MYGFHSQTKCPHSNARSKATYSTDLAFCARRKHDSTEALLILFYVNWQCSFRFTDLVSPQWHTLGIVLLCGKRRQGRRRGGGRRRNIKQVEKGKMSLSNVSWIRARTQVYFRDKTIALRK